MIRINRPETSFLCRVPCRRALTVCPGTASGILTTFKNKGLRNIRPHKNLRSTSERPAG